MISRRFFQENVFRGAAETSVKKFQVDACIHALGDALEVKMHACTWRCIHALGDAFLCKQDAQEAYFQLLQFNEEFELSN